MTTASRVGAMRTRKGDPRAVDRPPTEGDAPEVLESFRFGESTSSEKASFQPQHQALHATEECTGMQEGFWRTSGPRIQ